MIPVISFVGRGNSGKTTYLEKLIPIIKARGYRVGIVKHDVHGFEMDTPGKDTWRHRKAGADVVCISSPEGMAMIKESGKELSLDQVLSYINDVDVIFTEGYKKGDKPKIEVFRTGTGHEGPVCSREDLLAVVSDGNPYPGLPVFPLEEPELLADFLIEQVFSVQ